MQIKETNSIQRQAELLGLTALTLVTISAAATLDATAFGQAFVCTGTAADYAVTLPPATGNSGKTISIRMARSLTKFVTITASGGELIDGQGSRLMWSGESATLVADGGNWYKIGGVSRSMMAVLAIESGTPDNAQTINNGLAPGLINLNTARLDNTTRMLDLAGHWAVIARNGNYNLSGSVAWAEVNVDVPRMRGQIMNLTGTPTQIIGGEIALKAQSPGSYPSIAVGPTLVSLAAGDKVGLYGYHAAAVPLHLYGAPNGDTCALNLTEVSPW